MVTAIVILGGLGLVAGTLLIVAFKFIAPPIDERIEKITEALPGANCGGCGFPGCAGFAEAIVKGNAELTSCAPGGGECVKNIASILGVEAVDVEPKVAVVQCAGDRDKAVEKFHYLGVQTCAAASLLAGGPKLCPDGCMGYGDCVRACVFDAVRITPGMLAVVDRDKCTGCGKCVDACPKHVIKLVPKFQQVHVLCSTRLGAKEVKKFCSVGCTGCKLCTKEARVIAMDEGLAVVSDDIKEDFEFPEATALVCQSGSILDLKYYDAWAWATDPRKREDRDVRAETLKEDRKKARAAAKAAREKKAAPAAGSAEDEKEGGAEA
jgi:electron transport complex protein RnfB